MSMNVGSCAYNTSLCNTFVTQCLSQVFGVNHFKNYSKILGDLMARGTIIVDNVHILHAFNSVVCTASTNADNFSLQYCMNYI